MITKFFLWIDHLILSTIKKISIPLARLSLFTVFTWFGALKLFGLSPANPLVADLLHRTMPFIGFDNFIIAFGLFEVIIGVLFILPKYERVAIFFLVPHMIMTSLPLFLLPSIAWSQTLVPTLEGQYIIKNLAIVSLALAIASHLRSHRY
jgi:uncharacterized membrane protein YkgB